MSTRNDPDAGSREARNRPFGAVCHLGHCFVLWGFSNMRQHRFVCEECECVFTRPRRKHSKGHVHRFCSRQCFGKSTKGRKAPRQVGFREFACAGCGVLFRKQKGDSGKIDGSLRYCSRECLHKYQTGSSHPSWKLGRVVHKSGYVLIHNPGHHRTHSHGYVLEHILVAEKALGKPLPPGARIHHVNSVRDDNRPCNLVVCQSDAYHKMLHARIRRIKKCIL